MASSVNRDFVRRLRTPAYAFLIVTLIFQITDFFIGLFPLHLDAVVWRFAAFGSAANSIGNVLLLVLLIFALALVYGDQKMMVFVGIMSVGIAVFLFTGAGSFSLDAMQLRSKVETTVVARFDMASVQALIKMLVEGLIAVLFAIGAFKAFNAVNRELTREDRGSESHLIARSVVRGG